MNSPKILVAALTCLFLLFGSVNAAIVINEVELNPSGADSDKEWVELYNNGPDCIDTTGWKLRHKDNDLLADVDSYYFCPDEYMSVSVSGPRLTNSGDFVRLLNSSSDEVDITHTLIDNNPTTGDSRTWQRIPNGNDTDSESDWQFCEGTSEAPNTCTDPIPEFPTFILPVLLMLASLSLARKYVPLRF